MPIDRAKIEYFLDDLKTRPERMRLYQRIGVTLAFCLVILVVFLLSRSKPMPKPKPKNTAMAQTPMTQGVRDAFELAKTFEPLLRKDSRYARVYLVPSAATPAQKFGKLMVMGEMASEDDLHSLQAEISKLGVSVPMEWQVSISASDSDESPK